MHEEQWIGRGLGELLLFDFSFFIGFQRDA